jgi:hypothetical protein
MQMQMQMPLLACSVVQLLELAAMFHSIPHHGGMEHVQKRMTTPKRKDTK